MTTTEAFVAAVRARGSDARDVRDAAHEAFHALHAGVPAGQLDRESIHSALMAMRRGDAAASEVHARAVERLVCEQLGAPYGDPETWVSLALMEAVKSGVAYPSFQWLRDAIDRVAKTAYAREKAAEVLALAAADP